ncbi:DUF1295 domain-containing protein [Nocardioides sp.]|uniref:DUF1295 domain-containing protein n=1 Tax=Nocardioides sp. TaxID=35761 RepID=UPI003517CB68
MDVVVSLLIALLTAAALMTATALVARRQGRVVVVDVAWGLGFVLIALTTGAAGLIGGLGDAWRTALLMVLVGFWGLRLASHIHRRSRGHTDEDPRYATVLGGTLAEVGMGVAVRKVFLVQGLAMTFIALPVAVGAAQEAIWWPAVVVGVVLWAIGLFFEAVGDAQLAAYRAQPRESRPQVLDTGLWRYTRHPNYFGDASVWWGIWLVGGLGSGWIAGAATVIAPLTMTWFLMETTGAKLLEKTMMQRPGYPEYAARTSKFLPLPPKNA